MRGYSSLNIPVDENLPDQIVWNEDASKQKHKKSQFKVDISEVFRAHKLFSQTEVVQETALMHSAALSAEYQANIYIKREDHQRGRTYKIRAAYYQYVTSDEKRKQEGYVLASDGNFAVSYSIVAGLFKSRCVIFVPENCYCYKLAAIQKEGKEFVQLIQIGSDFQSCTQKAIEYAKIKGLPFLLSYETPSLFNGYATIAKEIVEEAAKTLYDFVLVPAGAGALASSIASLMKQISPQTRVIAVEPDICKPYSSSIFAKKLVDYERVSKFCNGSSIKKTSQLAYQMGSTSVDGFIEVTERKLAERIIKLYSIGLICQPSGALSIAGLEKIRHLIKGKNIVCILSGANIDLTKLDEARQMSVISKGIKNYYIFSLPNRKKVVYDLITQCFRSTDIISIQFSQRFNKESSQLLLSVESLSQEDVEYSLSKFQNGNYSFENINDKEQLLDLFF